MGTVTGIVIGCIVVAASAWWVHVDAGKRDWSVTTPGEDGGHWPWVVLLFWIVGLPLYLYARGKAPLLLPPAGGSEALPVAGTPKEVNGPSTLKLTWWSYGAALVVLIGSVGPWATVGPVTVDGTHNDGFLSLILALIAAAFVFWWSNRPGRGKLVGAGVAAGLAVIVTGYDTLHISSIAGGFDGFSVSVGWGLLLALAGSLALTALLAQLLRLTKGREGFAPETQAAGVPVHPGASAVSPVVHVAEQQAPSPSTAGRSATVASVPAHVSSDADELTKLADLRDRGVLTDAEFTAKKQQILSVAPPGFWT